MKGSTSLPQCVGILRIFLKYRLDIAFEVHEVSKTLLGTQKPGIMIRKSKDCEHLDAYTDAEWSGDSINRKSTSVGVAQGRVRNIASVHEG